MQQYLLSIYQPEGETPPPAVLEKVMRDMYALIDEAKAANVWVFNGGLHPPSTATVVRVDRGETLVTDGPFVESKEHLGGFIVIKASDLDEALAWGRRLARVLSLRGPDGVENGLAIEIRPFQH